MSVINIYSPTQAALGVFLGGPLASVYFIKQNFAVLDKNDSMKQTLMVGGIVVLLLLVIVPFLPENFPNMAIPIVTVISTKLIIEKYQFKKEDILADEKLSFHSNWRVFFVAVAFNVITLFLGVCFFLVLDTLGITSLA